MPLNVHTGMAVPFIFRGHCLLIFIETRIIKCIDACLIQLDDFCYRFGCWSVLPGVFAFRRYWNHLYGCCGTYGTNRADGTAAVSGKPRRWLAIADASWSHHILCAISMCASAGVALEQKNRYRHRCNWPKLLLTHRREHAFQIKSYLESCSSRFLWLVRKKIAHPSSKIHGLS